MTEANWLMISSMTSLILPRSILSTEDLIQLPVVWFFVWKCVSVSNDRSQLAHDFKYDQFDFTSVYFVDRRLDTTTSGVIFCMEVCLCFQWQKPIGSWFQVWPVWFYLGLFCRQKTWYNYQWCDFLYGSVTLFPMTEANWLMISSMTSLILPRSILSTEDLIQLPVVWFFVWKCVSVSNDRSQLAHDFKYDQFDFTSVYFVDRRLDTTTSGVIFCMEVCLCFQWQKPIGSWFQVWPVWFYLGLFCRQKTWYNCRWCDFLCGSVTPFNKSNQTLKPVSARLTE